MPVWTVSQRFSHPQWRRLFKEYQQRLQISDLHFNKFLTPITFACWKRPRCLFLHNFFRNDAMDQKKWRWLIQWMIFKSSSSTRGISMPNFEVLDARIASALNKIIHNSHFKRRISLEEKKGPERGPFPSRKTDCLLDLQSFPGH